MTKDYLVDMHIHTTASDGTLTPGELLEEIKSKGLSLFSITDHDSIDNIREMQTLIENSDIHFIPGVEISVTYEDKEVHLLTYGIRVDDAELNLILNKHQALRNYHNDQLIKFACTKYDQISIEDYHQYVRDPKKGGWKAENYLLDRKVTTTLGDFFALVDALGTKMTFESPEEILPILDRLGYTVVLAHPPAYKSGQLLPESYLNELVSWGLKGIECFSPYYKSIEETQYYVDYCQNNGLLITCGSDYHGQFIPSRRLGDTKAELSKISYKELRLIGTTL